MQGCNDYFDLSFVFCNLFFRIRCFQACNRSLTICAKLTISASRLILFRTTQKVAMIIWFKHDFFFFKLFFWIRCFQAWNRSLAIYASLTISVSRLILSGTTQMMGLKWHSPRMQNQHVMKHLALMRLNLLIAVVGSVINIVTCVMCWR